MENKTQTRVRIARQITELEKNNDYGGRYQQLVVEYSEYTNAPLRSPKFWAQIKRDAAAAKRAGL